MAGVKTGASGMNILDRDVSLEEMELGEHTQKMMKAKQTGSGIGGLLGAVIGVALAPVTGGSSLLLATAGGAAGAYIGGKVGESQSGVDYNKDILGGKFRKRSRARIGEQIGDAETAAVWQGAIQGAMGAGTISGGLKAFSAGAKGAAGGLFSKLGGGLKSLGQWAIPGGSTGATAEAATTTMSEGVLSGTSDMNITDIVQSTQKPAFAKSTGGLGMGGEILGDLSKLGEAEVKLAGGLYKGADKLLGGLLPGGQKLSEGYIGKGISGLLGPKVTGQEQYSPDIGQSYERASGMDNLSDQDFADQWQFDVGQDVGLNLDDPGFSSQDQVLQFQQQYNDSEVGPPIGEDGLMGPQTLAAWRLYNQGGQ